MWKRGRHLTTSIYREPTNTGLLLRYHQSHVDYRYKISLLKTMLNRAYRLSSNWELFINECENLKRMFLSLKYPSNPSTQPSLPLLCRLIDDGPTKSSHDSTSGQTCPNNIAFFERLLNHIQMQAVGILVFFLRFFFFLWREKSYRLWATQ